MTVVDTSLMAWMHKDFMGKNIGRQSNLNTIKNLFLVTPHTLYDQQIMKKTCLPINIVTARRNDLVKLGFINHKGYCQNAQGRKVRTWGIV